MKWLLAWLWLLVPLAAAAASPPSFEEVRAAWTPSEATLRDRHGSLLQQVRLDRTGRRLAWTPLSEVSPSLIRALLTAEDRRFVEHHGVDWRAVGGALWQRLRGGSARGASTLSMQLAASLDPELASRSGHRSWPQKFGQMRAALALERNWTKSQILEAYLNRVSFRGELQGIGAAAQGLFGKTPSGLTDTESLLLVAALPSPKRGWQAVAQKACLIARGSGFGVSCPQLRDAAVGLDRVPGIEPAVGWAPHLAARLLRQPGESLNTTVDSGLQRKAAVLLAQQLSGLFGRNVRDGAALVADNDTGDVLAYVGSAGPRSRSPQVDGVQARRQAGSTLKPFVYGLAIERGYLTAASLLNDTPVQLETPTGLYIPQNYDREFKGTVSLRTALAGSLNVPAVRTLMMVEVERFRDRLHDIGYAGITEDGAYYGFSLALGSAEVSLMEQVNAYRTLANGGVWSPLRLIPERESGARRRILAEPASFIVADILADRASRAISFGLDNPLTTRYWSAVKTGTSKDMRDNWCIGFSRRYTVGVWVGNFEGDAMHDVSGVTGAAPVWLGIMDELHALDGAASRAPEAPAGLIRREVRFQPAVEPPRVEWFIAGTEAGTIRLVDPEHRSPRLASPPNGVVIALDPDVPPANQSVIFTATAARPGTLFHLDGRAIAPAERHYKWQPTPGRHHLTLLGATGKVLDTAEFTVRQPPLPRR